jgi:hypothetical protein
MVIQLGMYEHFCTVHGDTLAWDPWAKEKRRPSARPVPAGSLAGR